MGADGCRRHVCSGCRRCSYDLDISDYALWIVSAAASPDWRLQRLWEAGDVTDADLRWIETYRAARR